MRRLGGVRSGHLVVVDGRTPGDEATRFVKAQLLARLRAAGTAGGDGPAAVRLPVRPRRADRRARGVDPCSRGQHVVAGVVHGAGVVGRDRTEALVERLLDLGCRELITFVPRDHRIGRPDRTAERSDHGRSDRGAGRADQPDGVASRNGDHLPAPRGSCPGRGTAAGTRRGPERSSSARHRAGLACRGGRTCGRGRRRTGRRAAHLPAGPGRRGGDAARGAARLRPPFPGRHPRARGARVPRRPRARAGPARRGPPQPLGHVPLAHPDAGPTSSSTTAARAPVPLLSRSSRRHGSCRGSRRGPRSSGRRS